MADWKFRAYVLIELTNGRNVRIPDNSGNFEQIITVLEADQSTFTGFDLSDVNLSSLSTGLAEANTNADATPVVLNYNNDNLWQGSFSTVKEEIVQTQIVGKKVIVERLDWHTSDEVQ